MQLPPPPTLFWDYVKNWNEMKSEIEVINILYNPPPGIRILKIALFSSLFCVIRFVCIHNEKKIYCHELNA